MILARTSPTPTAARSFVRHRPIVKPPPAGVPVPRRAEAQSVTARDDEFSSVSVSGDAIEDRTIALSFEIDGGECIRNAFVVMHVFCGDTDNSVTVVVAQRRRKSFKNGRRSTRVKH